MSEHLRGRVIRHSTLPGSVTWRWFYYSDAVQTVRQPDLIVWEWQVVNTITGKVVHRDNSCCTLAEACDRARENVRLCRDMWRMGIRSSDLKRSRR